MKRALLVISEQYFIDYFRKCTYIFKVDEAVREVVLIDNLVVFFAIIFYAFLFTVYLLRARGLSKLEWKLSPVFSMLLVPFVSLWVLNLIIGNSSGRLLSGLPIIAYLSYDL